MRDKENKYSNSCVVRKKKFLNETKNHPPVDTHTILINAIKKLCLSSRNMIDKTMCEVL